MATYEEWKKAVESNWPKRNATTLVGDLFNKTAVLKCCSISCFEEKVLGKMAHQPGSAISSQLFVNEASGTTGFLSAV